MQVAAGELEILVEWEVFGLFKPFCLSRLGWLSSFWELLEFGFLVEIMSRFRAGQRYKAGHCRGPAIIGSG